MHIYACWFSWRPMLPDVGMVTTNNTPRVLQGWQILTWVVAMSWNTPLCSWTFSICWFFLVAYTYIQQHITVYTWSGMDSLHIFVGGLGMAQCRIIFDYLRCLCEAIPSPPLHVYIKANSPETACSCWKECRSGVQQAEWGKWRARLGCPCGVRCTVTV